MIEIKYLKNLKDNELGKLFNRYGADFTRIMMDTVVPIVKDVKENGDSAVIKYTEKFDGVKLSSILATPEEIDEGYRNWPGEVIEAFNQARKNIEDFHARQQRENISYTGSDGATMGILYQPIESAAVYVPGGKACYPSSVLMGVIPAKIAGVENITLITPPDKNGNVPGIIAAVCKILGVEKIVKAGGAQGIAAAGLGTESVTRADIIVGPGNIYVTAAKAYLASIGAIQIDSIAGPSEVLIIADEKSDPKWVAWELLSQAEHDERAIAILLTPSKKLAEGAKKEIEKDIDSGIGRHAIKKTSINNNGFILITEDIDQAITFSNSYAPEHMVFMVDDPMMYLHRIRNVGSLFLGRYSPVAAGDYFSGTNHILPTGGAARFSSGTSVDTFLRKTTYQHLTKEALEKARGPVGIMSKIEGFEDKHGGSIEVRFEEK